MKLRTLAITTAALALTTSIAFAAPAGIKTMNDVLVDANGMTLYTFDKDGNNTSNCYDQCATNWPPLMAKAGASADGYYSIVERNDGTQQWAYNGDPLYLWVGDQAPGDKTGDGVGGVWHIAEPSGY